MLIVSCFFSFRVLTFDKDQENIDQGPIQTVKSSVSYNDYSITGNHDRVARHRVHFSLWINDEYNKVHAGKHR